LKSFLILAVLAFAAPLANANLYNFTYKRIADNQFLVGQIDGILQADGNTIVVSSIVGTPSLGVVPGILLPFVVSTDFSNFNTPDLVPKVTIDGSFMDILAYSINSNTGGSGFAFAAGNLSAATYGTNGAPFVGFDGVYGAFGTGYGENFFAANWTISPVPELSSANFLIFGVVFLAWMRRVASAQSSKA